MRTLLFMGFKLFLLSLRRQLGLNLMVVAVVLVLSRFRFLPLFGVVAWLLLAQCLALRAVEQKEGWQRFFFSLAGHDIRAASYLYVLSFLLAVLLAAGGAIGGSLWSLAGSGPAPPAPFTLIAVVTGCLAYFHVLLLISEFVPYERVVVAQKLSILVFVVVARVAAGLSRPLLVALAPLAGAAFLILELGIVLPVVSYRNRWREVEQR